MSSGTVKYFNERKGWGIISTDDVPDDVYVHYTAIKMDGFKTLKEGQQVLFDLAANKGALHAQNVLLSP